MPKRLRDSTSLFANQGDDAEPPMTTNNGFVLWEWPRPNWKALQTAAGCCPGRSLIKDVWRRVTLLDRSPRFAVIDLARTASSKPSRLIEHACLHRGRAIISRGCHATARHQRLGDGGSGCQRRGRESRQSGPDTIAIRIAVAIIITIVGPTTVPAAIPAIAAR